MIRRGAGRGQQRNGGVNGCDLRPGLLGAGPRRGGGGLGALHAGHSGASKNLGDRIEMQYTKKYS